MVRDALRTSQKTVQGGDEITPQDVERAIFKGAVKNVFGNDPLAKLLVKVIANGAYVY